MQNKKPVIAYLHTHFDPEWYRTEASFNVRLVEIFDKVLMGLERSDFPSFYFDGQVLALLSYLKFRPEKKRVVQRYIKEKKLFIGPFFVSADNLLVSGEALKKNLEIGLKIAKSFGAKDFIGYLSDTFGHSKSIFEILKSYGIEYAVIWRGAGKIPSDFTSNGVKTSRLVYGYYQDVLHTSSDFDKKAEILEKILDKIDEHSSDMLLLPLGGDHLAPPENARGQIEEINKRLKKYEIKLSSPFEYLNDRDFSKFEIEGELLDNSETFILPGVYSTRIPMKAENARLQWDLFNKAYKFDKMLGGKYKAELDFAATELLKNHAHDSIYGCSTDDVEKAVEARQITVKDTIEAVVGNLTRDFKNKTSEKNKSFEAVVFNFSKYPQNGVIKIVSDKKIKNAQKTGKFKAAPTEIWYDTLKNPMTEDFHDFFEYLIETEEINPNTRKNVKIKAPVKKQAAGKDFIENENLKMCVADGEIYVVDKTTGDFYPDFIRLISTKDGGDSYNSAPLDEGISLKLIKTEIKEDGPIKSTFTLVFEENIKLNVSLTNGGEYFEIEADFTNKKKNRKLQISLNTGEAITKTLFEEAMGRALREHDPDYSLYKAMPVKKREELKTNSFPTQRFVCANGVSLITLGLNEYEIYKNCLKITLLRSTGIISNPKNPARGVPAGPPIECPLMQEIRPLKLNFAIALNKSGEDLSRLADSFYGPFIGFLQ